MRAPAALLLLVAASANAASPDDFFEKEVRPILVERCGKCHGDDKPKGGLRLTSRALLMAGGDGGPAAIEGKPDESPLVAAVRYQEEPKMPPKGKLPESEIDVLTRWVAMGLPWPESPSATPAVAAPPGTPYPITDEQRRFWSFQPIRDPKPPAVKDAAWPRGAIDQFLLAAMETQGLQPAEPADKRTLLRRATFDLIGLPPTPEEVDAFLADETPDAFATVVERLLASPRYGERWGRHWLDVVRYADSRDSRGVGGADDISEAWRYRDWVVSAFNRDLPYDRFLRDQLAGDLLPAEKPGAVNAEGLVATGLLTIGEWGTGDADKEKMMTDIVDDQVDVVGRAVLGLTIACARCHDHKFDPIPTADYYGLAGIFFSTHILPDPGAKTAGSPMLRTPLLPASQVEEINSYKGRLAAREQALRAAVEAKVTAHARSQLPETGRSLLAAWDDQHRAADPSPSSRSLAAIAASRGLAEPTLRRWVEYLGAGDEGRTMDQPVNGVNGVAGVLSWRGVPDCPNLMVNTTGQEAAIQTFKLPPRSVSVHPGPKSAASISWTSPMAGAVVIRGMLADADPVGGDGITWAFSHRRAAGSRSRTLAEGELANGGSQPLESGRGGDTLRGLVVVEGDVLRLDVMPKGEYTCDMTTVALTINPVHGEDAWDLAGDLVPDPLAGGKGNPHADHLGHPAVWRFAEVDRTGPSRPVDSALAAWDSAVAEVASGGKDRTTLEDAAKAVQAAIDRAPDSPLARELTSNRGPFTIKPEELPAEDQAALKTLRDEYETLKASPPPPVPLALAAQEGGVPRSAHEGIHDARIHVRGNYQRLGETVPRHFPRIVAGDDPPPITVGSGRLDLARWVCAPGNPLTARVMANRLWQYHFGEGIVRTPSNFGKLGVPPTDPDLLDFLASRFVEGGWSVKAMHRAIMRSAAYQQSSRPTAEALKLDPENHRFGRMNRRRLESEAIRDGLLAVAGRLDPAMGGVAYQDFAVPRRTLYLMTIRSDRSSFGPLFDAADSTAMVDRRTNSTVAPQSLFLLNHAFAWEQAKALAVRLAAEAPGGEDARIQRAYRLLYGRAPEAQEVAVGRATLSKLREAGPEDRAWAAYCQVLLCANEFVYVD